MLRYIIAASILIQPWIASAQGQELRIGFLTTLSGSGASLGQAQLNGFRLGLDHEGWKADGDRIAGAPAKLFITDDQQKPDIGLKEARRLIESEKVQVLAGFGFSNVLMGVQKTIIDSERIILSSLAAASPMAAQLCSVYFTATSAQTSQWGETIGKMMTDDGIKRVFVMAPNYQAGKDTIAGFKRYYSGGEVVGESLFKLGEADYQTEISRVRASNADALFLFAPGAMGISFVKQWAASGVGKTVRIYSVGAVDELTLPAIGPAAVGSLFATNWNSSSQDPVNRRFIKDYTAKHGSGPSFYAALSYDSARLLAAAVHKLGGRVEDTKALAQAIRRTPFPSTRGALSFNVNGIPIQNWYRASIALTAEGKPEIITSSAVVHQLKDSYWTQCPPERRY